MPHRRNIKIRAMSRRCCAMRCGDRQVFGNAAGGKYLPAKFDDLLYKKKLYIALSTGPHSM